MKKPPFCILGMRTIKTVLAVALSALFMKYALHQPMFFACVGAVVAVEKTAAASLRASIIRNIGTLTGGLVGIAIASFTNNILLISLGLIPVIWVSGMMQKQESIVPAAIVYFAVSYLNTTETAWIYGLMRILGTFIGTLIGLCVNFLICPPKAAQTEEKKAIEQAAKDHGLI